MPNKLNTRLLCMLICLMSVLWTKTTWSADLYTLFITPQERQLIDNNRYKTEAIEMGEEPQELIAEQISAKLVISGIALLDGSSVVWINNQPYENGSKIDDKMRVKIMHGNQTKVRITAPDGEHYFGVIGDTLDIVYQALVEK